MNLNVNRIAGLMTALVLVATFGAHAQNEEQQSIVITGHPYSARRTITTTHLLPNGSSGKRVVEVLLWRDDKGRTREEQIQRLPEGGELHIINVTDPIARQHLAWSIGSRIEKEVFVTAISNALRMVDHLPGPILTPAQRPQAIAQKRNPNISGERLGTAIINGVEATGLRTITIIPSEQKEISANKRRVYEQWRSTEREDLIVRSVTDDPPRGTTDSELTDISFSNPAPSLFEPPPGYRVQVVTALRK